MRAAPIILTLLFGVIPLAHPAEPAETNAITMTIHDSTGLSSESATSNTLDIILFKAHTHIHLKISNTTQRGIMLFRPYCPEGDDAMAVEFRSPNAPDVVFRTRPQRDYTAGMGITKAFTLAPGDDLLVNVGFLSDWPLPFPIGEGETRELEVRSVYRSAPLTDKVDISLFGTEKNKLIWEGSHTSKWQKARIINRSGKAISPKQ